jgi:DNA invertase Pin-like site-specific DNA recombinase
MLVMRVAAYTRVSTREQAEDGHGLDAQRTEIARTAEARGWRIVAWCEDAGVSGAHLDGRDGLSRAIAMAEAGQVDGVLATKIDRVSRSVADFAQLVSLAREGRWNLVVLDIGLDLSTPTGEFVATIMCAAAQLERRMIGQRTKDGLAAAKAKGVHVGRPRSPTSSTPRACRLPVAASAGIRQPSEASSVGRPDLSTGHIHIPTDDISGRTRRGDLTRRPGP